MARTYRRNKKHLVLDHCGTFEETRDDRWWDDAHLTPEQTYARRVARFTRDHPSGRFGVPHWYRRLHGSKRLRLLELIKLRRHLRDGEWEKHLPENRTRTAKWYWW